MKAFASCRKVLGFGRTEQPAAPRSAPVRRNWLACTLVLFLVLPQRTFGQSARPELHLTLLPDKRGAQISVVGPPGQFERLEISRNLTDWRTLTTLFNSTGKAEFIDSASTNDTARFYRTVQFMAAARLQSSQSSGGVGARLELFGPSFSATPGDNIVRIGGVPAPVLEASTNRLLVEVSAGAASGSLSVITPNGLQKSQEPFTASSRSSRIRGCKAKKVSAPRSSFADASPQG